MLKIHRFTKPELDEYRDKCNFTEQERECFDLKAKHKSAVQIADTMHCSTTTVSKITKIIKTKIEKVTKDAA